MKLWTKYSIKPAQKIEIDAIVAAINMDNDKNEKMNESEVNNKDDYYTKEIELLITKKQQMSNTSDKLQIIKKCIELYRQRYQTLQDRVSDHRTMIKSMEQRIETLVLQFGGNQDECQKETVMRLPLRNGQDRGSCQEGKNATSYIDEYKME